MADGNIFALVRRSKCILSNANKNGNNYIFTSPSDKLNIIGAHYKTINSPRFPNQGSDIKMLVDRQANLIKSDFNLGR